MFAIHHYILDNLVASIRFLYVVPLFRSCNARADALGARVLQRTFQLKYSHLDECTSVGNLHELLSSYSQHCLHVKFFVTGLFNLLSLLCRNRPI